MRSIWLKAVVVLAIACTLLSHTACSSSDGPRPQRARAADTPIVRDIDPIYRGLIGAETTVRGAGNRLVSGIGLVVGLDGTGSGDVPANVRVRLEEEMLRYGVGTAAGGALSEIAPGRLIDRDDTAVVLVQAVVPIGSPRGTRFDVRVSAWPGSSTTSLAGGRLYTTELRGGVRRPNEPDVPAVATANGDLYLNPFLDDEGIAPLTVARVLSGGTVLEPEPIRILLDNPSHARARQIVHAINSSFPQLVEGAPVARGENDESIRLSVPLEYADRLEEFVRLIRFTRVNQAGKTDWARRYADAMLERPAIADDMGWALRALGRPALPFARRLYTSGDVGPRLAAIEAGAALGDPTVFPHLEELTAEADANTRVSATRLLARLDRDPRARRLLRELLSHQDAPTRIAAYQSLDELGDSGIFRINAGDSFAVDVVPSDEPTVFVRQQEQPLIVVFGDDLRIREDAFLSVWDGRFLMRAEEDSGRVRVRLRPRRDWEPPMRASVDPDVVELVGLLGRDPEPGSLVQGFDLNYSDTVRVLAEAVETGAIPGAFVEEDDLLRLALLRARDRRVVQRPGLIGDGEEMTDEQLLDTPPTLEEMAEQAEAAREQANDLRSRIIRFPEPIDPDANDNN